MSQLRKQDNGKLEEVNITVVYDNNSFREGLQTDWGFSCLVEVGNKRLLFDTGGNGSILLNNMDRLGIVPGSIDFIFLSHHHYDHTGGLSDFLKKNSAVTIYYPQSFPDELTKVMQNEGKNFIIPKAREIKAETGKPWKECIKLASEEYRKSK